MQVKLKVLRGASAGKEINVRGPHFIIGRSEECNLRANSDAISREHCQIEIKENEVTVQDLGSKNGTFLNGSKLEGPNVMAMGDQLRVGPLEFLVTVSQQKVEKPQNTQSNSSSNPANNDDLGGMISDWLSEADEEDRHDRMSDPDTREYKTEEADSVEFETTKNSSPSSITQSLPKQSDSKKSDDKQDKQASKKKQFGKLPKQTSNKNSAKDTQEAAAQTLRKFFNRG